MKGDGGLPEKSNKIMEYIQGLKYSQRLSELVRNQYAQLIEKNQCYSNVYHMCFEVPELDGMEKNILFCFVYSAGVYIRHAFLICDGQIIEPLILLWNRGSVDLGQIIPIRLLDFMEYLDLLNKSGDYSLSEELLREEIITFKKHDIRLDVFETSYLAQRLSDTPRECAEKLNQIAAGDKSAFNEDYKGAGILVRDRGRQGDRISVVANRLDLC